MDTIFSDAPLWIIAICFFAIVIVATIYIIHYIKASNPYCKYKNQSFINNAPKDRSPLQIIRNVNNVRSVEVKGMPRYLLALFGVCSIISFIYCICNLSGAPIKLVEKGTDYVDMGVVVGIFSFLVTLLVTWQIAQTLISKDQINTLENKISASAQTTLNVNLYNVFLLQGHNERKLNNFVGALNYYIRALDCASKENGDKQREHINELMRCINNLITSFPDIQINSEEAENYSGILSQIEHHHKDTISNFIIHHSSKDAPKSEEITIYANLPSTLSTTKLHLKRFRCPLCGGAIVYSRIPYQLPFNEEDYIIDSNFSEMRPAICLYGECAKCGYVILRNIKPLISSQKPCDDKTINKANDCTDKVNPQDAHP